MRRSHRMVSSMLRVVVLLSAVLALACQGCTEDELPGTTQLTVRLHASQDLIDLTDAVRVQVYVGNRQNDLGVKRFEKSQLRGWPVDIQVVPAGRGDVSEPVEVIAEALGRDARPIVEQRALTSTVPHEQRVLDLTLAQCGKIALNTICEPNPGCRGTACRTCVQGKCDVVPRIPGMELGQLEPTAKPVNTAIMDASIDSGPPPRSPDGGKTPSCADDQFWQPTFSSGRIPEGAAVFATPELHPPDSPEAKGPRNQFICRADDDNGGFINGKANGKLDGLLDWGCYYPKFDLTAGWMAAGRDAPGAQFEILSPPEQCKLRWVARSARQPLPDNALPVTHDRNWRWTYACRVEVREAESTGPHIGMVVRSPNEPCRVQFFGRLIERLDYEILVQDSPLLPPPQ